MAQVGENPLNADENILGSSEYYNGGCGCGGVEGGSLGDVGSAMWNTIKQIGDDPLIYIPEVILMAVVILCVIIVILYVITDIDMTAFGISMIVVGLVALVTRAGFSLWSSRPWASATA